jgi:hypothetical protein
MSTPKPPHLSRAAIKERIDRAMLSVTRTSVIVAVLAAGAAFWSVWEAHETRADDERPFINPEPSVAIANSSFIRIQLKNNGKSAAKNLKVTCINTIEDGKEQQWGTYRSTATFPYLLPTIYVRVNCRELPQKPTDHAKAVEMGVVEYDDLSNHHYTTPFCFVFDVPYTEIDVHQCEESRGLPPLE